MRVTPAVLAGIALTITTQHTWRRVVVAILSIGDR